MRSVRGFIALLAGAAALSFPLAAQAANGYAADLSPETRTGHAPLGAVAVVEVAIHNYGPNTTESDTVAVEIVAPGGTVFGPDLEQRVTTGMCQVAVAHKHMTCKVEGELHPDGKGPGSDPGPIWGTFDFTVQACTTPGKVRAVYKHESKPGNNTAPLTVTVDGIIPCTRTSPPVSTPSAKPSASASVKATASASASASPSAAASASATEGPVESDFPVVPGGGAGGPDRILSTGGGIDSAGILSMGLIIGGAALLVLLVLVAAVVSLRGRGRDEIAPPAL
ncbi:hypothetical protein F4553_002109 [Allocatelliglobosispora scoriae]|uniref:DUF11 domain-containing protein n=1 Tax=Allocatelliglobosispora scoriae TaxID=643052 RepID=A0A841BPI4_9ACTN|nr:hypothetical protein [Allocatelliglobosispora scoriae]MBB5868730.1 hypothetical protein [Allocatelliglobosispora scoriae]